MFGMPEFPQLEKGGSTISSSMCKIKFQEGVPRVAKGH